MLKVTLVKSTIRSTKEVKATVAALGLNKINSFNTLPENEAVKGQISKVAHLVKVENV